MIATVDIQLQIARKNTFKVDTSKGSTHVVGIASGQGFNPRRARLQIFRKVLTRCGCQRYVKRSITLIIVILQQFLTKRHRIVTAGVYVREGVCAAFLIIRIRQHGLEIAVYVVTTKCNVVLEANRISTNLRFTDGSSQFVHDSIIHTKGDAIFILGENAVFICKRVGGHFLHFVRQNVYVNILAALDIERHRFRHVVRSRTKHYIERIHALCVQCLQYVCRHYYISIELIRRRIYNVFVAHFFNGIKRCVTAGKRKDLHRTLTATRANAVVVKGVRRICYNVATHFICTTISFAGLSIITHRVTACGNRRAVHQRMS